MVTTRRSFDRFASFYSFYLDEHRNRTSRRLHVVGTGLALAALSGGLVGPRRLLVAAPLCGYGLAWLGHAAFERNRPATFSHPLYSLAGDLRLFAETLLGRRRF